MRIILLFLLMSSVLTAWEPPFYGNKRPVRQIKIQGNNVFRSAPGKDPVIVMPGGAPATVRFAGAELKKFLSQKLKRPISVVSAPVKGKYPIILGLNEYSAAYGIKSADLCRDGFIIRITPQGTVIAGRDDRKADPERLQKQKIDHLAKKLCFERGTYFGVLDFLERFAGVRFFFPHDDFIIVPGGELELPEAYIFDRPDFEQRWYSPWNGFYDDPAMPGAKEKESTPVKVRNWFYNRMQTVYTPNNHGLHHLQIAKRFSKTHPEYLAVTPMKDGKGNPVPSPTHFCYTRGLKEVVAQDAIAYFQRKKAAARGLSRWSDTQAGNGVFSVMPSDGMYKCRCAGCQKYFNRADGKGGSELIWGFTADIARALTKAGLKGWISQDAYSEYIKVPRVDIPSNVLVTLCTYGPWSVGDPAGAKKEQQLILDWRKKANKPLILWNYALKYSGRNIPWIPDSTPRGTAKYYQTNAPHIYGMFMESGTDFYIFHYLTYYILGKVAWDNKVNVDLLLKEHFRLLYGPAADLMMSFFDRLEYLWLYKINGRIIETALGPTQGTVEKKELYENVYNDRELAALKKKFDAAVKLCAKNPQQLRRIGFIRKHFLKALESGLEDYRNFGSARSEFGMNVSEAAEKVCIDGKADDKVWKTLPGELLQKFPASGKNSFPRSIVKVCRDKENLYCLFECTEPEYDKRIVSPPGTVGHEPYHDDGVELFLMSDPAQLRYYQVVVNSAGAVWFRRWKTLGGRFYNDPPWQVAVKAAVGRTGSGWCAEIVVPLKALEGFNGKMLSANFCRHRRTTSTESYAVWSPFLIKKFHETENFGKLFFEPAKKNSLLLNPDFLGEKKGTRTLTGGGWGITAADAANGSIALDQEQFVYGGQSLSFSGVEKGKRTGVVQSLKGKLKPDTEYRLSFYIRCDNVLRWNNHPASGAWVCVFYGKYIQVPRVGFSGSFPWRYHTFRFRTPAVVKSPFVSIRLNNASGKVNFDRVTLEEVK